MGWNVGHENSGAGGMDLPRLTWFLQGPPDISLLPAQTCVTYSQQRSQHEPFKHQTRLCYSFAPVSYPKSLPWPAEPCSIWLLETSLSTPPNPISLVHAGLIAVPPTNHQASASRPLHLCSLIYLAPSPLLYVSSQMPLYQRCLLQLPCVNSGFSHSCCSPCSARSPQLLSSQDASYGCFFYYYSSAFPCPTGCWLCEHERVVFLTSVSPALWAAPADGTAKFIFPEVTNWDTVSWETVILLRVSMVEKGRETSMPELVSKSESHAADEPGEESQQDILRILNPEDTSYEDGQAVPSPLEQFCPRLFLCHIRLHLGGGGFLNLKILFEK